MVVDQEEENKEILDEKCRKLTRIPKAKVVMSTTTPMKVKVPRQVLVRDCHR